MEFCLLQMSDDNPEMRETAARICRDYLNGVWKHVTADNIIFKRIRFVKVFLKSLYYIIAKWNAYTRILARLDCTCHYL